MRYAEGESTHSARSPDLFAAGLELESLADSPFAFVPAETAPMALVDIDRQLLRRCLDHEPEAWRFVDRFLGVIHHVIRHTAHQRSMEIDGAEGDDLAAEVFKRIVEDDYRLLRHFRHQSSLATYLTVVARRLVVNHLARKAAMLHRRAARDTAELAATRDGSVEKHFENEEEVRHLISLLKEREADLVRGFYLEHKSYADLSQETGIPVNSVGPTLARIRAKLKKTAPKA